MVKKLQKSSTAWVGRTNVTDRQTDGRPIAYSDREREFTFAKNDGKKEAGEKIKYILIHDQHVLLVLFRSEQGVQDQCVSNRSDNANENNCQLEIGLVIKLVRRRHACSTCSVSSELPSLSWQLTGSKWLYFLGSHFCWQCVLYCCSTIIKLKSKILSFRQNSGLETDRNRNQISVGF